MSSLEPFEHNPLVCADKYTRLLILHAKAASGQNVRCSIKLVAIKDLPKTTYETISYVWGNPDPTAKIIIDDRLLLVPQNAETTLRRLQRADDDRTVWIDSVCIAQSNLAEKNAQIPHMGQIYQHCDRNLIYLGEDDGTAQTVYECLRREMAPDGPCGGSLLDINPGSEELLALDKLLSRPWFR